MADDFRDHIEPVMGSREVGGVGNQPGPQQQHRKTRAIAGRITGIHRGSRHSGGGHLLDVSVGGEAYSEIVLRVPEGAYSELEGKHAVLYVEE